MENDTQGQVLLFLDFDGVLHPSLCLEREHFCRLPLFEAVMRRFPGVRIVISSSWRHHFPLAHLLARFSGDIAGQVVGTTPLVAPDEPFCRHREILAYLELQGLEQAAWLALDDSSYEFPARCANLQLCDGRYGLTEAHAEDLAQRLSGLLGRRSMHR